MMPTSKKMVSLRAMGVTKSKTHNDTKWNHWFVQMTLPVAMTLSRQSKEPQTYNDE